MTRVAPIDAVEHVGELRRRYGNGAIRRRTMRARETGFAEVVVVPDEPVATSRPAAPPAVIELEIARKMRLRIPLTTPPTLAAAMVKALGVS